jgi:branched-chain amino acid transport system substrate-binding protein
MAHRTVVRAAALLGALSVVIAGCGGGKTTTAPGPATAGPPAKQCDPRDAVQAKASGQPNTAPLKIGTLLPETGSLSFLGPPEFAAIDMAVKEINAGGGVLGNPVVNIRGDSGDDKTDTANQTVDRELGQGAQVIIGAAASGVTKLVIDKITGAGLVEFSPANTSDEFTCWPDKGLYFRTAPPDRLQAQALAALMATDGAQRISILARNDPYGSGLANNTVQNLRAAGIPQNQIQKIIYDPNATSYNTEIDDVRQFNPDAIAVIGFDESKKILTRMSEVRVGPGQKLVYGTDGNMGNALGMGLPPGLLNGMKGTAPLSKLSPIPEWSTPTTPVKPTTPSSSSRWLPSGQSQPRGWTSPRRSTGSRRTARNAPPSASAGTSSTVAVTPTTTVSPAPWTSPPLVSAPWVPTES